MSDDNGLPALPAGINVFSRAVLLVADAVSLDAGAEPQWGIFDSNGDAVVISDNVVSMAFAQDFIVSEYPQEQGSFVSYNKSTKPKVIKVQFSTGGSLADRQTLIDSIAAIAGDTNLYMVVTPEASYPSSNITHYAYDRNAANVGLLKVDVWLKQIAIAGTAAFSNTSSPTDASQTNQGNVQPGSAAMFQNDFGAFQ